jgi:hypothetical protein
MEQENLNIQETQQESIQEGGLRGGKGNNTGGNGPQTPFEDNRPETLEQKELLSNLNTGSQGMESNLEQQLLNNAPQDQTEVGQDQGESKEITEEEIASFILEEEPLKVIDKWFREKRGDKDYYEGYKAFVQTEIGQQFIARFSSDENVSAIDFLEGCEGGDMQEHTLNLIVASNEEMFDLGYTKVYLLLKNDTRVELSNVTAQDIQNSNLEFEFNIYVRQEGGNKEEHAQVLGHEIFVHAESKADAIARILNLRSLHNESAQKTAERIQNLGKTDIGGHQDHKDMKNGEIDSYELYLDQLKQVKGVLSEKIDQLDAQDKAKY